MTIQFNELDPSMFGGGNGIPLLDGEGRLRKENVPEDLSGHLEDDDAHIGMDDRRRWDAKLDGDDAIFDRNTPYGRSLYVTSKDNVLFLAPRRLPVRGRLFDEGGSLVEERPVDVLFDHDYESTTDIPEGHRLTIDIEVGDDATGFGPGEVYIAIHRLPLPQSVALIVTDREGALHETSFEPVTGRQENETIYRARVGIAAIKRLTLQVKAGEACRVSQVEWRLDYPNRMTETPSLDKTRPNRLYHPLHFKDGQGSDAIVLDPTTGAGTFRELYKSGAEVATLEELMNQFAQVGHEVERLLVERFDQPSGPATLDETGRIRLTQLPYHLHEIDQIESLQQALDEKADMEHEHRLASAMTDGFMSKDQAAKLLKIEHQANRYEHPNENGSRHVPVSFPEHFGKYLMATDSPGNPSWEPVHFGQLANKPTDTRGYGITDALTTEGGIVRDGKGLTFETDTDGRVSLDYLSQTGEKVFSLERTEGEVRLSGVDRLVLDMPSIEMLGERFAMGHEVGDLTNLEEPHPNLVIGLNQHHERLRRVEETLDPAAVTFLNRQKHAELDEMDFELKEWDPVKQDYLVTEHRRPDGTLYMRSRRQDGPEPDSERLVVHRFEDDGTTIVSETTWGILYDASGTVIARKRI